MAEALTPLSAVTEAFDGSKIAAQEFLISDID